MEPASLADHEVLEMVLAPVVPRRSTREVARALLNTFGTLGQVLHAPATDLLLVGGIEEAGVVALKAVRAAALHMLRKVIEGPSLRTEQDLMNYLIARLRNERVEVLFIIFLNSDRRVIADEIIFCGFLDHVHAYPREVIRRCLALDAVTVILAHNHPSGNPVPSAAEVQLTHNIVHAGKAMGIIVQDHIIVGNGKCFSFRNQGLV